jgi:hypothetical protein
MEGYSVGYASYREAWSRKYLLFPVSGAQRGCLNENLINASMMH